MLLLFTYSLSTSAKLFEVIKEHSRIGFDLDYMLMIKAEGQFKDYSGTFILNNDESEISDIKIIVNSATIDTNDVKRDFHLKGHEFFFVANYPKITFEAPGPIKLTPGQKLTIPGTLVIRGIKRPFVLEGFYKGKIKDPWDKYNYFFNFTGEIDRKNYGISWNKTMDNNGVLIGENVRLAIIVQAQALDDKTAFSTHMVPATKGIIEHELLIKEKKK
jgi:polyisoprenoid-binding protein YceI